MAVFNMRQFVRQTAALSYKNLLATVIRQPIGFLLMTYGLPLAILAVLLCIPSFITTSNVSGIGSPAPIRDFSVPDGQKFIIIKKPTLGADVDRVINTFTKGIDKSIIRYLETEDQLANECLADLRGISGCHASVTFWDSPETTGSVDFTSKPNSTEHTWQYTIRADPIRDDRVFNIKKHDTDQEKVYLPLQLAVNNAITNSTTRPEVFMFTRETEEEQSGETLRAAVSLIGEVFGFAVFASYWLIIYRLTSQITNDRESGMAQLVDAMGGGSALVARVLSWLIVYNIVCLPAFIGFGALYQHILFPTSSVSVVIGWQILLGMAVNSSTVFASSFFTKSRVSAIYVVGVFLLMSVAAQVYSFQYVPEKPQASGVYPLTLLFSSSNHLFFFQQMCLWELNELPADITKVPKALSNGINSDSYNVSQSTMLLFLGIQIIVYPILAILVEKLMHGIDFRHRSFTPNDKDDHGVVAEAYNLKKRFTPNFFEQLFCCGRRKEVTAVDGVSLQGHKGQILCLVGPNGSGKTTTLHMMAGFISPTAGTVKLGANPSQIGICPQRNTLWDNLTVSEHVSIWRSIKSGNETSSDLKRLIADCDLTNKTKSYAKTLSGGQKRKLQLACMFVGDSSVCLIDECTSGLDPLSRRVIWDILLDQRSKRSILFTTHFLDEVDVLADHIVILSKGKVRCHGTPAELKNLHGGGYRLQVPLNAPRLNVPYPAVHHQDSLIYHTPDSRSAAQLLAQFTAAGVTSSSMAGPQVEDVFLNVADEPELAEANKAINTSSDFQMTPAAIVSFLGQVGVLFRKRFTILKRFWWPYFYVLALPLVINPFFDRLLMYYERPTCEFLPPSFISPNPPRFIFTSSCAQYQCETYPVAPAAAFSQIESLAKKDVFQLQDVDTSLLGNFAPTLDNRTAFLDYFDDMSQRRVSSGGIYGGSGSDAPIISGLMYSFGNPLSSKMLTLWSQMTSGVEIVVSTGVFAKTQKKFENNGVLYAVFFTLLQAIYPAAFSLYPAIEKNRKVRSLEYANGVRRGPLWVAYALFDFLFVCIISVGVGAIMSTQFPLFKEIWIMLPILLLYGLAAILLGYVISHFVSGPLKAFMASVGLNLVMFAASAIAVGVGSSHADAAQMDSITVGITFGLNLLFPIGNVFRAALLVLNVLQVSCKGGQYTPVGSIFAFGGPILYLVIQNAVLLLIIVWIEGDLALFRRRKAVHPGRDMEKRVGSITGDVDAETVRVEQSEDDFLRALHVSKSFGSNRAVDDVTLGLPESDVLALIGPNGAGKSTLVNLIQSELSPDRGQVLLRGEDARTRSAQRHLGVCPQHDALDLMNTREHLEFYARIKGIKDVKGNVGHLMTSLNLTPHASTLASKLSGGNKRKLSLAIALMGTPPVLVLDEPTSAMDAVAKRSFWKVIEKIAHNRSVLLTTHSMEEADALATRAAIISKSILAVGTTKALRDKYSNYSYVTLVLRSAPNSTLEEMEAARGWVQAALPGSKLERAMLGGQIRFTIPGGADTSAGFIDLIERYKDTLGVEYYSISGPTLERVFLSVVKENNVLEEDGRDTRGQRLRRRLRLG